ncbi:hypothetical protein HMPREF0491_01149, partial [Lachnospiraceae oral taxon 107 str. F0167]
MKNKLVWLLAFTAMIFNISCVRKKP